LELFYRPAGEVIVIVFVGRPAGGCLAAGDDVDQADFFDPDQLPELAWAHTGDILARWRANR
jgi:hypothetical protein